MFVYLCLDVHSIVRHWLLPASLNQLKVKNLMCASGKTAAEGLLAPTNWPVTNGLTREKRSTNVQCAAGNSCAATTCPSTSSDTRQTSACRFGSKRWRDSNSYSRTCLNMQKFCPGSRHEAILIHGCCTVSFLFYHLSLLDDISHSTFSPH